MSDLFAVLTDIQNKVDAGEMDAAWHEIRYKVGEHVIFRGENSELPYIGEVVYITLVGSNRPLLVRPLIMNHWPERGLWTDATSYTWHQWCGQDEVLDATGNWR